MCIFKLIFYYLPYVVYFDESNTTYKFVNNFACTILLNQSLISAIQIGVLLT